jgi:hypothetical protein
MATFTIDSENNIVAHAGTPASADHLQPFSTEKELAKLAADWPGSRLAEIWNSFAGITPFGDLKPVKKFTNRQIAVARIWQAVERLAAVVGPAPLTARKGPSKSTCCRSGPSSVPSSVSPEPNNKKAQVIAMMLRPRGVSLGEIIRATGWQKHTVRGFVSLLGSKAGQKIESSKNPAGERNYRIAT